MRFAQVNDESKTPKSSCGPTQTQMNFAILVTMSKVPIVRAMLAKIKLIQICESVFKCGI